MRRLSYLLAATSVLIGSALAQEVPTAPPLTTKSEWVKRAQETIARNRSQATDADGIGGNATTQIRLNILPDGAITRIEIAKPSGVPSVDAKAVDIVQRTGSLPPFTADMRPEPLTVQVPVRFELIVPPGQRQKLYLDTASGYRLEVPQPFSIATPRGSLPRELLLDVMKVPENPSPGTPPSKICTIRFEAANSAREAEPDAPSQLTAIIDLMRTAFGAEPGEIESTDLTTYRGGTAVEMIIKSKDIAKGEDKRAFLSSFSRPDGSIMMACISTANDLSAALPIFRSIRDGAEITPR